MGIVGLSTFIDRNTYLLHSHELKDCSVVIDGNNLYHHLYRACRIHSHFGGDYDIYREKIIINFKSILKCGITPYVVFDGGYTTDDRKLRKCRERAIQRIRNVRLASRLGFCQLTPLLAHETFLQALDELRINHVTCQFEADNEIAKLANKLKCPVISNDSDFYIFDLVGGFLPMDYIDFNPLYKKQPDGSKSYPYLYCRKYHVDDFVNSFEGISRNVLPIFGTLLGNDYFQSRAAEGVYSDVRVAKEHLLAKSTSSMSRVRKVLGWFEMHNDDSNNVLDMIQPCLKAKKKFLLSVNGYFDVEKFEACDLMEYFLVGKDNFQPKAASTFSGYNGTVFPSWFLASICKGEITPGTINAAVLHRVIFLCQSEKLRSPSSHLCSEFVRKVIYGILMASDPVRKEDTSSLQHGSESCDFRQSNDCDKTVAEKPVFCGCVDSEIQELNSDDPDSTCDSETDDIHVFSDNEFNNNEEEVDVLIDEEEGGSNSEEEEGVSESGGGVIVVEDQSEITSKSPIDTNLPISKQTCFEEYAREGENLRKVYIEPILSIGGEVLPSLSDIGGLAVEERLSILVNALSIKSSFLSAFSAEFSLYPICLYIWIQHASPSVTEYHLDCVILCSILLHMLNAKSGGKKSKKKSKKKKEHDLNGVKEEFNQDDQLEQVPHSGINLEKMCEENRTTDKFQKVLNNLDRYHSIKPVFNRKFRFEAEIPHAFSQLQSCMLEVSTLDKLLRFPLPKLKPASLINGTFLYNFYNDIITRPTPHSFIESMLLTGTDMHNAFLTIKAAVIAAVPSTCFGSLGGDVKKRKKKCKGRKNKKVSPCDNAEVEEAQSQKSEESEEEMMIVAGFDVRNKFSLLCM